MTRVFPTAIAVEGQFNGVDWTDFAADVSLRDRIVVKYGITGVRPTDRVAGAGTMKFSLKNSVRNSGGLLGYYSPEHANVRSGFEIGLPVRLKITYGGTDYYKFYGTIRNITVMPGKYRDRKTKVEVVDWLGDAGQHKMDLVGVVTNQRSDQVIDDILGNMTKQPNSSDIEQGQSTFAFAMDGLRDEKTTALAAIQKVTLSEFGYCYVIGDQAGGGKFRYEDRHERVVAGSTIATISEDELSQMDVSRSDKLIYNIVRATSFPRSVGSSPEILYSLPSAIQINAGSTETIIARYRDPSQESARISGSDMQTPVASTDYMFGSSEGAGIEDLNASLSIVATFGANSAKLALTNGGAVAGYLNLMQLRGDAVRLFDAAVALAEDETSKTDYGDRPLDMSLLFQDSPLEAQDFADITLANWKDPKTIIKSVGFWANRDATRMVDALEVEPGSKVALSESLTAIGTDYFVNGVELTIQEKGLIFAKWTATSASEANYWLLGTVGASEIGETTVLGF